MQEWEWPFPIIGVAGSLTYDVWCGLHDHEDCAWQPPKTLVCPLPTQTMAWTDGQYPQLSFGDLSWTPRVPSAEELPLTQGLSLYQVKQI